MADVMGPIKEVVPHSTLKKNTAGHAGVSGLAVVLLTPTLRQVQIRVELNLGDIAIVVPDHCGRLGNWRFTRELEA
ncbi:MAG: hypothetical protein AB7O71_10630 [Hyphomicrobiaceae bacterium]